MKVEFKVSMNDEEKRAGNIFDVEIEVDEESASWEDLIKYAMKAYKVELQSQIRPNWEEFIKGNYPKELKFGEPLFAKRAGVVTLDKAKNVMIAQLSKMSQEEKVEYLKSIGLL